MAMAEGGDRRLVPTRRYFSDEFTEVNLVFRTVPMLLTAVMITMLRPTAIRQYSMAVAPDSSLRNFENSRPIQNSIAGPRDFSEPVPDGI
jgi:hypothetical protein